jgi:capsular exopolysaccharide synthesis family protein
MEQSSQNSAERPQGTPERRALPVNGVRANVELLGQSPAYQAPFIAGRRYGVEIDDEAESGNSLLEYWRLLRRHKAAILLSAFGGIILGIAVGIPMTPVYRARTSLEVLNLNEDFMNMKQASPVTTTDNSYDTSEEETQAKLLEGDALQNRVMAKLDPAAAGRKAKLATSGWRSWLHLSEKIPLTDREEQLGKLSDSLKIRPTVRTRVLEVTADSSDAQLGVDYLNTLVSEFMRQSAEARINSGQVTGGWLKKEIDDARASLQHAEDALQTYARNSGLIFTSDDTNVETEKLQTVEQQLSGATADRITKQSHFELARNSPPDSLGDVISDDGLRDTITKISDLRSQIASMNEVFNPGYSKLKQAQAQLAALEVTFQTQRANILKHIEDDYIEASNKEKLLARAYDTQVADVTGQGERLVQYNILKREADSSRQLYDTILQQTKQASIATAMRASNVRVVDPAEVPDRPVFPNHKLDAALGFFGGLFLSIVFVSIRARADRTLQQPGDVKLWTDILELGAVPSASFLKLPRSRSAAALADAGVAQTLSLSNSPFELVTLAQRSSVAAEAYRSILTSILFVGDHGNSSRVLVFTSPNPREGKTSTVCNLALATAEIRRTVLIIDADLRRPRMHDLFAVNNDRGLSDILREELSPASLAGLIRKTVVEGVYVLPAGGTTEAAVHLLYSPNFAALIDGFRSAYDLILIDAPPMLHMTDARVAGRLADAVVLVARSGKTTRDALIAARDRFAEDRIPVLGTILNDWNPKQTLGGYYGYAASYKAYRQYQ